jgi:Fic family protein
MRQLSSAVKGTEMLNHRQQAALLYSVRNPHQGITVKGHAQSHGVSYLTARKDLQQLESMSFLRRIRAGTADRYFPTNHFINLERKE